MTKSLVVYHGTSQEQWAKDKSCGEGLYVTTKPLVAAEYAHEWGEEDETPLVLRFSLSELRGLPGIELRPNYETVEQYEAGAWGPIPGKSANDLTWEDTLACNGTFVIGGFAEQHKHFAKAIGPMGMRI